MGTKYLPPVSFFLCHGQLGRNGTGSDDYRTKTRRPGGRSPAWPQGRPKSIRRPIARLNREKIAVHRRTPRRCGQESWCVGANAVLLDSCDNFRLTACRNAINTRSSLRMKFFSNFGSRPKPSVAAPTNRAAGTAANSSDR
jgi:hypothetical protein